MNRYIVQVNNRPSVTINASRMSVAVHRAMDTLTEGELRGGWGTVTVVAKFICKVEYNYDIVADVPMDPALANGTKRTVVQQGWGSEGQAQIEANRLAKLHPDWKFLRTVKREIPMVRRG